jgi:glycosyltransferase involved in cell wall biosynthesis
VDRPDVTVIIPVLDNEAGLAECLRGLDAQTYPRGCVAIVVADNGSTPPLDAARLGASDVTIVRCDTPGSYAARNEAVLAAGGKILAFTDADCVPDTDWLEQGVMALQADGASHVVGGEVLFRETNSRSGTALYQLRAGFGQEANVRDRGFTVTANLFCTIEQFRSVGPFDESLYSGGDREWCWRARRVGIGVRFAPRCVVRTLPRVRLRDAVRQARRVAAGRAQLARYDALDPEGLRRDRTLGGSISWVWFLPDLSFLDRARVLTAAAMIRAASALERLRLRVGGIAEHR